jgi:hypothetical protein
MWVACEVCSQDVLFAFDGPCCGIRLSLSHDFLLVHLRAIHVASSPGFNFW